MTTPPSNDTSGLLRLVRLCFLCCFALAAFVAFKASARIGHPPWEWSRAQWSSLVERNVAALKKLELGNKKSASSDLAHARSRSSWELETKPAKRSPRITTQQARVSRSSVGHQHTIVPPTRSPTSSPRRSFSAPPSSPRTNPTYPEREIVKRFVPVSDRAFEAAEDAMNAPQGSSAQRNAQGRLLRESAFGAGRMLSHGAKEAAHTATDRSFLNGILGRKKPD